MATPESVVEAADAYAREMAVRAHSPRAGELRAAFKAELVGLVEQSLGPDALCTCGDGRVNPQRRFASHADDCPARDHPPPAPTPLEHLYPEPGLAEPLVQRDGETEEEFGERKAKWEAKRAEERKTEAERRGRDDAERERRAEARRLAVFGRVSKDEPPPLRRFGPATGEMYRDGKRIA